jgi:hypothetical protein
MASDDYLETTRLIDCRGRTTHTLTLLPDGTVRVTTASLVAVVDPRERGIRPRGVRLGAGEYSHDQVVKIACDMVHGLGG